MSRVACTYLVKKDLIQSTYDLQMSLILSLLAVIRVCLFKFPPRALMGCFYFLTVLDFVTNVWTLSDCLCGLCGSPGCTPFPLERFSFLFCFVLIFGLHPVAPLSTQGSLLARLGRIIWGAEV